MLGVPRLVTLDWELAETMNKRMKYVTDKGALIPVQFDHMTSGMYFYCNVMRSQAFWPMAVQLSSESCTPIGQKVCDSVWSLQ